MTYILDGYQCSYKELKVALHERSDERGKEKELSYLILEFFESKERFVRINSYLSLVFGCLLQRINRRTKIESRTILMNTSPKFKKRLALS